MTQHEIEIILCRHWASYLETPIFLVDTAGNLLFYNEPAEKILGQRFSETGEMPAEVWGSIFEFVNEDGISMKPEELPLTIALTEGRPIHMKLWLKGLDNVKRYIQTTCFPLIGQADRFLGAVALFWEMDEP